MVNSRAKGKRGELEAAKLLRHHGIPARRGVQFAGGPESPDLVTAISQVVHFEVKMVSRLVLEDWYDQAVADAVYRVPVVMHRVATRKLTTGWRVTLSLSHLAMMYGHRGYLGLVTGEPREIAASISTLPVSAHVVQVRGLQFERRFGSIKDEFQPALLVHSRPERDAFWLASMNAVEFLSHALVPFLIREFEWWPTYDTDGFEGELEQQYVQFWREREEALSDFLPLFKAA